MQENMQVSEITYPTTSIYDEIQAQREQQIEQQIEKTTKRFLKNSKQFRRVKTFEEASAILIFKMSDLSRYHFLCLTGGLLDHTDCLHF